MKINNKFLQYIGFSMAGGLVAAIPACLICCLTFMFFLIPLMPIIFIACWMIGSIVGWCVSKSEAKLPLLTYISCIVTSAIISYCVLHRWFYPEKIVACLIWTYVFSGVFAGCSYPVVLYVRKKIIPEIFLPLLPKSKKNIDM